MVLGRDRLSGGAGLNAGAGELADTPGSVPAVRVTTIHLRPVLPLVSSGLPEGYKAGRPNPSA